MAPLESQFEAACAARDLPGVVLLASDSKGKFHYQRAFGMKSPTENMDINATFVMASCTKLMTSISALQCVERGQIRLDDDVSIVLSELKDLEILTGFKEGTEEPILEKAKNKITLRQLLTHSSGIGSDRYAPLLRRWRASRDEPCGKKGVTMMQSISTPLLFEPGTGWSYGASTDWAGILVTRLNDMSLESYMQKYIWDPLQIRNITFHLELKPEVRQNLVKMARRGAPDMPNPAILMTPSDQKVNWTEEELYDDPVVDEWGTGGANGSAVEYMKILHSICANDGKLLTSETIHNMFMPQLENGSQKSFGRVMAYLETGGLSSDKMFGHGLAGVLNPDDEETGSKNGTLSWGGLPNLLWSIDRVSGLSLMYASNVLPARDPKTKEMHRLFSKEMYRRLSEARAEQEN